MKKIALVSVDDTNTVGIFEELNSKEGIEIIRWLSPNEYSDFNKFLYERFIDRLKKLEKMIEEVQNKWNQCEED